MSLIDFILNLAALLLWLNWLVLRFDPLTRTSAASLVGTLRKADTSGPKRWKFLTALAGLLLVRAVVYWQIGPAVDWTPKLELGAVALSFRSEFLGLMFLFSLFGFGLTLAVFYLWLLLLSVVNRSLPDTDPLQKLVRLHLGWVEPWPAVIKLALPFVLGGLLWAAFHPLLARLAIVPQTRSHAQLWEQAAIIGLMSYVGWKYLIVGILLLHLLNSYVYLGNHSFWNFINNSARNLLFPLRGLPLKVGKVDFSPIVAIAVVFLVCETVLRLPTMVIADKPLARFLPF